MKTKTVLISGAGIAGPTLAYWLLHYGFEPVLVERAPALREGGYMIDFWGVGYDVAERMALLPVLHEHGYRIQELRLVDREGNRIGGFGLDAFRSMLADRFVSLLRGDLAKTIWSALGGRVETIFGDRVEAIEQHSDGIDVAFAFAAPRRFDLVIGADGLHSGVRSLVFGPEVRFERYLGYYAASFSVVSYPYLERRAYVAFAQPGRQVARYSLNEDRTVFLFVFASDRQLPISPHDTRAQKQVLRDKFADDSWEFRKAVDAMEHCSDLYFDAVSQISMDAWSSGRVGLVGDACFCPSLLAGQGSALAMAAAYVLAGELNAADGDYRRAFGRYEMLFHPFIVGKQMAAVRFATSFAPRTKLGIWVRNLMTRLMSMPWVADWAMGSLIKDGLILPNYDDVAKLPAGPLCQGLRAARFLG
jgi:2-polyprenyl-6-methoxyphenol hydroxylase-like FAD-dependent oxidoreductase